MAEVKRRSSRRRVLGESVGQRSARSKEDEMSDEKKAVMAIVCGGPPQQPNAETLPETCPECGAKTQFGFGLMGGGYGAYVLCEEDGCEFFAKRQSEDGE